MPRLVDYPHVVEVMTRQGLVSLYPNSGAFGFPTERGAASVGWIDRDDPSIRPESRPLTRRVPGPCEPLLASLCCQVWTYALADWPPAWVTPKSHWAYELMFGSSAEWLPQLLRDAGLSPEELAGRHDGSAVEFAPDEKGEFDRFLIGLLLGLFGSDFQVAWPGRAVICTIHHHKQLWWSTTDPDLLRTLDALVPPVGLKVP